ncbi:hypothetical protein [Spirilliplanes yamanashiensis]|uniref:Uncharacterized protein n=1 Tax=Spirilliplanes yamanashiensis TaxID=42233 RepID=A0A8J4DKM3_9ACTN|nr:hypothetical protein [Spirilliplanes yamanashiensis]MDP9817643.1 hypothetical protein [Spirilliplanes yamanashiensis]GIJ04453.1 hypothetical protein Sya03_38050 [Spirilliplanes yamanashiensis]
MVIAIRPASPQPGGSDTITLPAQKTAPHVTLRPATPPQPESRADRLRRMFRGPDLGLAPAVLALSAVGALLVALAYDAGRDQRGSAMVIYWLGQVVVFSPVAARLLSRRLAGAAEAFVLVMGLAITQYVTKWIYSPDQFRFPDELQHWLGTTLIMETGRLFEPNPALPPAVNFPGLAEMGAAVSSLTGLSVTAAGLTVAGIAHLVFVGALFVTVQRAGATAAVAGLTCVVYATALHYLFFNSMYLYQTAALPFLMFTVWAYRRWRTGGGWRFALLGVVTTAVTTVAHHVTAFMLIGTLALLAVTELAVAKPRRWSALLGPLAAFAVVAAWIWFVARDVIGYLSAPVDRIAETVHLLMADKDAGAAPVASVQLWQLAVQGLGLLALGLLFLVILKSAWTGRKQPKDVWLWAALAGSVVFFLGNGVRFLGASGPEIAGRLSTFTYVPISIVAALALVRVAGTVRERTPATEPAGRRFVAGMLAGTAIATLLLAGARAGGWPPVYGLLPGPYLAAGFERSVDDSSVTAAQWLAADPGHRLGGDITGVALGSTYGRQDPVREAAPLYEGPVWTPQDRQLAADLAIDYLWVDRRMATQVPASGAYFENDPKAGRWTSPIPAADLAKFDRVETADRVYDNGNVRIYRMGNR